jgi:Zn-dependent peptidase ImmA (M78 family)
MQIKPAATEKPNRHMVTLAREARGMTQTRLAELTNISQASLSRFAKGEQPIPHNDLETIALALQFPTKFFYQDDEELAAEASEVFHRMRRSVPVATLDRIHAGLNIFRITIKNLLKGVPVTHRHDIPHYKVRDYNGDIEYIAEIVRAAWKVNPGPIDDLIALMEDAYIFIHFMDFETDLFDETMQWPESFRPIMLMNSRASGERIRYTLAHTLGHMVLHHNVEPYQGMEVEADRFAAAFLMPAEEIKAELEPVTIEHLVKMKPAWGVSLQALIRRAKDVGLISETRYKSLFEMLSRSGYRKSEPFTLDPEEPTLFRSLVEYHQMRRQSISQIADIARLSEDDFREWYNYPTLRLVDKPITESKSSG